MMGDTGAFVNRGAPRWDGREGEQRNLETLSCEAAASGCRPARAAAFFPALALLIRNLP